MINHRGPEFSQLLSDCVAGVQWALETSADVLFFPASGTGGLEAGVVNLLSPGDSAVFCSIGSFGDRWAEIATAYGVDVVKLAVPWGQAVDPADLEALLDRTPAARTVFVTHNETSTAVVNDLEAIAQVVKSRGLLLAVDSVSGAGCVPVRMDELGLDLVVCGSQKGWMAPPGLTMVAASAAALEAAGRSTSPRWYLDLLREKSFQDKGQTCTTPPLSVLYALHEGLAMLREEGRDELFARHRPRRGGPSSLRRRGPPERHRHRRSQPHRGCRQAQ
jgi:aspartate aminotransferase-like enzyme